MIRSKSTFLIFTNVMILFIIFALLTQALVIIPRIAATRSVKGIVEVQRSGRGEFTALSIGSPIKTGDVIRTGADSEAEFRWTDGTRWKLMSNTQLTVKKAVHNMLKRADDSELELSSGAVFVRIVKALAEASRFEVATPTAVAAVRGTIFSVSYTNGQTKVAVFKGHVKVTSSDSAGEQEKMIEPGQAAIAPEAGSLSTIDSAAADRDFQNQPTIIKPEIGEITARALDNGEIHLGGFTEAGDKVTIDGRSVRVLGNGFFEANRRQIAGKTDFVIVTTDKHGEQTQVLEDYKAAGATSAAALPATPRGAIAASPAPQPASVPPPLRNCPAKTGS